ncbi:hypothetical protein GEOBC_02558 [Geobacteraceae bacterium]|nr:hypothetical protein GEOBC_02558 [Geobacteraceae bacterium]
MAAASRDPLIATRASSDTKARFAALAAARGMTESRLLMLLIDTVLERNSADASSRSDASATERVTVRLRPGDRALLDARAAMRRMKSASYVVALIRAHVRGQAPLPKDEIDALKVTVSHLTALRRQLEETARAANAAADLDMLRRLQETATHVEDVRRHVAEIVKTNLMSWEASDA